MKKTRECTYSVRFFERVLVDRSNNTVAILKSQRTLHKMAADRLTITDVVVETFQSCG